ncbi:MAG: lipopolysaccharide biosynthesis protein [Pontibacterium sp.]
MLIALTTRGSGMALQFLINLILVRVLGAEGIGVYSVYLAWVMVLSGVIGLGTPTLAMRRVSELTVTAAAPITPFVGRLLGLSCLAGLALLIIILGPGGSLFSPLLDSPESMNIMKLAALGAILFTFMKIGSESLKGLGKVNQSIGFENILMPLLIILLAGFALLTEWSLSSEQFIAAHLVIMAAISIAILLFLIRHTGWQRPSLFPGLRRDLEELAPLWGNLLIAMLFINLPIIMAPLFAPYDEVGVFSIAYKLIMITVNILMVLSGFFGPRFAKAYAAGDTADLKRALQQSRIGSLLLFLPVFALFIAVPDQVMGIFGEEYRSGSDLLIVMITGQLIYASTGLVGLFLAMTYRARLELKISFSILVIMAALIAGLGSLYGITGVAWGFALGLALKNLVSLYFTQRELAGLQAASQTTPAEGTT